jgi:type VI secretion system protein ImpG
MREELLEYYERELAYMRQMGAQFASKYPRVASRLLLEPDRCEDPHVERLLEGFAFLAARIHLRIDDDFPEMTASLLNILYPNYLRPIPPMTVVECALDPEQGKKTTRLTIPAGTPMLTRKTVDGMPCRFRTGYDVELWPFQIVEGEWRQPERLQPAIYVAGAAAALRLKLKCLTDVSFAALPLDRLRFYLSGETNVVHTLYELLSANCLEILARHPRDPQKIVRIDADHLQPVGFEENESLLPHTRRSFAGYRMLQEYFTFQEKFLFFDLKGLEALQFSGFTDEIELIFLFSKFERPERQQMLELGVNARTFRTGCTPIINLYPQSAEPILVSQTRHEYPVVPDMRHEKSMEIYSIDEVLATNPNTRETTPIDAVYKYRSETRAENGTVCWTATRRSNQIGEREPSTMYLSIVDIDGRITDPNADVLSVRCMCTNHDLPSRLPFGAAEGDFFAEGFPAVQRITALRRPTASYDAPDAKGQLWRLVSQLSLNYLSLTEDGREALQEILRLHNFTDSSYLENQVGSILALEARHHFALVGSQYGLSPARGTKVDIHLDEQQFTGGGAYLFTSVLERFLSSYAQMNSFCQLSATTNLRKGALGQWPPRAGNMVLL